MTAARTVGANVRAEISRRGVTQNDLGRILGLSQPSISARLRGAIAFDVDELEEVASALRVSVEVLVAGVSEPV